jgi:hypothetical protein
VRNEIPMVEHDRRQDLDIQRVLAMHRAGALPGVRSASRASEVHGGGEDPIRA